MRLKYTVNLTKQADFLFAVANVVIWGFAENALGMFVGNVATLRPLFRKILNRTIRKNGYGSRSYRTGASGFAPAYQLSEHTSQHHKSSTVTNVRGLDGNGRDSQLSDGDSQTRIIRDEGTGRSHIMVSQQVNIEYD